MSAIHRFGALPGIHRYTFAPLKGKVVNPRKSADVCHGATANAAVADADGTRANIQKVQQLKSAGAKQRKKKIAAASKKKKK